MLVSKAGSKRTKIIEGSKRIRAAVLAVFTRAKTKIDLSVTSLSQFQGPDDQAFAEALAAAGRRGLKPRMVTEVTKDNMETVRIALGLLDVRHVANLKANFVVSESEYLSSPSPTLSGRQLFPVIRSNDRALVEQHQYIFDTLWNGGEPAIERIAVVESGSDLPELEIIRDAQRVRETYTTLVQTARNRILLLLPTSSAFNRDDKVGVIRLIREAAEKGVRVRILAPVDPLVLNRLHGPGAAAGQNIETRSIPPADVRQTVTALVIDTAASLTIEERDSASAVFDESVGVAILATGEPRVRQTARFFERSWMETELVAAEKSARAKEERSRRQAELMQDIMTHDIRNFNQMARLNAELLEVDLKGTDSAKRVAAILRAVDGSTRLIEKAKELGGIIAAEEIALRPTSIAGSFERAVSLVRSSVPQARVQVRSSLHGSVFADELLDEVFVNILTNSVRYTVGNKVRVVASQESARLRVSDHGRSRVCWKVSVSDHGRGIPETLKPIVFRRYLETAKGSGLGLSIVHALATDRYGGKVSVRNRVEGDFTKGTVIELLLPKASSRLLPSKVRTKTAP